MWACSVSIHVYVCVRACVCMYVRTYVCMHASICREGGGATGPGRVPDRCAPHAAASAAKHALGEQEKQVAWAAR